MLTDLPPSTEEEKTVEPSGILPRIWLPPRQQPDETLPEFRLRPHQHHPTRDEQSTFRPVAKQRRSSCIPVPRILPDNAHGNRPVIEIERDMTRGLDTIQEESTNTMEVTLTNEEDGDLGQMYTLSNKTVAISNPDAVCFTHCNHLWEFRLYLVRANNVHTLGYKSLPGVM